MMLEICSRTRIEKQFTIILHVSLTSWSIVLPDFSRVSKIFDSSLYERTFFSEKATNFTYILSVYSVEDKRPYFPAISNCS